MSAGNLEYEPERASFPRSFGEWRDRLRDAARYGERISPPLAMGPELLHRVAVLVMVALITGVFISALGLPAVRLVGRSVGNVAKRFSQPLAPVALPDFAQRSQVLAKDGTVIATLAGEQNRIVVPLSRVPLVTQQAVIAIEDAKFYEHHGIDVGGLMRAFVFNFRSGEIREGGSTITQQLVKNTLVGNERSLDRKIKEARLAVQLEHSKSKHQILELYLNDTYFGNGVYGIGAAAEYYFGKDARALNVPESALLAGIIKAPEDFEPLDHPKAAKSRRNLVLQRMTDERFITRDQANRFERMPLGASAHPLPAATDPYFVEYIKSLVLSDPRFGATARDRARALFQAGLKIHTTLDLTLQQQAAKSIRQVLNRKGDPSSALVSIDPSTGSVRAMVGGRNFGTLRYNLAVQGRRQPGSTFKPMTMVAALDQGLSPALTFDTPSPLKTVDQAGKPWTPSNYDEQGHGLLTMRRATELSVNTYYVQLIQRVGPENVVAMAHKLGIQSTLHAYTSLALGTEVVSPFELAGAYATLANEGVHCKPFAITQITDANSKVVLHNEPSCDRAVSTRVAAQATSILQGVALRGTGRANGDIGRPVAEKTGTTDNYTDSWFAGYTPQFATVVWLGYPSTASRPLKNIHGLPKVFGGSLPAMIWARYMRFAEKDLPVVSFPEPPPLEEKKVPDVVGRDVDDAERALKGAGFSWRVVFESSKEPDGTVLAQDPSADSTVTAGSMITLTVSGTPPPPSPSPEQT